MVDGVMTKVKKNYRPLRMDFKSPAEHYISKEKDDEMDLEVTDFAGRAELDGR